MSGALPPCPIAPTSSTATRRRRCDWNGPKMPPRLTPAARRLWLSALVLGILISCGDEADSVRSVSMTRSEEHTSELQSLMRISYAVFCLKKQQNNKQESTSLSQ